MRSPESKAFWLYLLTYVKLVRMKFDVILKQFELNIPCDVAFPVLPFFEFSDWGLFPLELTSVVTSLSTTLFYWYPCKVFCTEGNKRSLWESPSAREMVMKVLCRSPFAWCCSAYDQTVNVRDCFYQQPIGMCVHCRLWGGRGVEVVIEIVSSRSVVWWADNLHLYYRLHQSRRPLCIFRCTLKNALLQRWGCVGGKGTLIPFWGLMLADFAGSIGLRSHMANWAKFNAYISYFPLLLCKGDMNWRTMPGHRRKPAEKQQQESLPPWERTDKLETRENYYHSG